MTETTGKTITQMQGLDASLYQNTTQSAKKDSEVGKDDFIKMLVTQLKNQDPLDPMSNDRFAVDLATFSQLEQLIDINKKIGTQGTADMTSMAGFLGTEVKLNTQSVQVKEGDGGSVAFKLEQDAMDVRIQLVDESGAIVDTYVAGPLAAGDQTVALRNLGAANGDYAVKVEARTNSGVVMQPQANAAGTVTGYRPGENPTLIVGNSEYAVSDILEVRTAEKTA